VWPFKSIDERIAEFWQWFTSAASSARVEAPEPIAGLTKRLARIDRRLAWACAPPDKDGVWTLEVSPDGQRQAAEIARRTVALAPRITGWRFVAFRQPPEGFRLQAQGMSIGPDECRYALMQAETGPVYLQLYVPVPLGATGRDLETLGFLILDHTFGEEWVLDREVLPFKPLAEAGEMSLPLQKLLDDERAAGRVP
jgi:hypothetical protein